MIWFDSVWALVLCHTILTITADFPHDTENETRVSTRLMLNPWGLRSGV